MKTIEEDGKELFSLPEIRKRYEDLSKKSSGFKAQLGKRIGAPDDLAMVPAFYKLFPGITPSAWHCRIAFILPYMRHSESAPTLGAYIGDQERRQKGGNLERRLLQIARAAPQQDIIYLRRLLMRFDEPAVNLIASGLAQFCSLDEKKNSIGKKMLIEHYFIARHSRGKGE